MLAVALATACSGGDDAPEEADSTTTTTAPLHAEEPLEDGRHFGFVTALDPRQSRLVFDPAALEGDDDELEVVNPDDRMHRLTISPDVEVSLLKPCCELHVFTFEQWLAGFIPDERTFFGTSKSHYWLTLADGKVVEVEEAHLP